MNRRLAVVAIVVAAVVMSVVGLVLVTRADREGYAAPPIDWKACGPGVQCGKLEVPLDHDDPSAGTTRLAVARREALNPSKRLGVLLFVPGGPGGPGTPVVIDGQLFGSALRQRFDLVSWDPRGVSEGTKVRCVEDRDELFGDLDPTPETAGEIAEERRRARIFVAACERHAGALLPHLSTVSSARDIDVLRASLGEEELSLLGMSYGTALGSVYATLFPRRVRAAVYDGAYDLSAPYERLAVQGAAAMELALTAMLRWCAEDEQCWFHSGGDPFTAFDRLMERLEARPLAVDGETLGVTDALTAVGSGLYSERNWEMLAFALDSARRGDGEMLRAWARPPSLRGNDSSTAIFCLDRPRGAWDVGDETAAAMLEVSPRLGRYRVGSRFNLCSIWPVEPDPPPPITGEGAGPALVVGATGDVATPLAASRDLADHLERASLLIVEQFGHTAYDQGLAEKKCATGVVDGFLVDLELPETGSVCERGRATPRSPRTPGE